jgi:hypothetical protein
MFVGHYAASYGAKSLEQRVPLWVLFVAVQFLDVLWGIFVLLGIEKVRIVPGITATNPLDLYYMPFTHSLVAALLWSAIAAVAYHLWQGRTSGNRGVILVGAAVLSHWFLDFLVHRPDLPLWANQFKVGLGLWNHPGVAFGLEAALAIPARDAADEARWHGMVHCVQRVSLGGSRNDFLRCTTAIAERGRAYGPGRIRGDCGRRRFSGAEANRGRTGGRIATRHGWSPRAETLVQGVSNGKGWSMKGVLPHPLTTG